MLYALLILVIAAQWLWIKHLSDWLDATQEQLDALRYPDDSVAQLHNEFERDR